MTPPPALLARRSFLVGAGSALLLGTGLVDVGRAGARERPRTDPFTLGVASGDPTPDGVVLWTRLAPDPLADDGRGGLAADRDIPVEWELAEDERFRSVRRRGSALAAAALGHSVHPEVSGLSPDRVYWYRFRVGPHLSPVGRTRTAPARTAVPDRLSLAFASCQKWHDGYYTAYEHLAEEDLDLVVHLGDYVYESAIRSNVRGVTLPSVFRREATTLRGYRLRYALYKSDRSLQRAHARFPWVHTFDDHEVENNWAGDHSQPDHEPDQDPAAFRHRRRVAFRAMYEHLPLRAAQAVRGSRLRAHRRLRFGTLADLTMLDTRQHRDDRPCPEDFSANCDARFAPGRTLLGSRQRRWLLDGWAASPAAWHLTGNQAPIAEVDLDPDPRRRLVYLDSWDGYVAERDRVLAEAHRRRLRNLVVLTGDRHAHGVADLRADYHDPDSPRVGTELIGSSISSGGDGADLTLEGAASLRANPHLQLHSSQRGYVRVEVGRRELRADFKVLPYVSAPGAPMRTRASFVVADGHAGAHAS